MKRCRWLRRRRKRTSFIWRNRSIKILETLDVIDGAVRPGTLITDAGSTKRAIVERAQQTIKRGRFVGGHPMAGKEARGVEAADANLFRTRPYVLTGADAESGTVDRKNWRAAGQAGCGGA